MIRTTTIFVSDNHPDIMNRRAYEMVRSFPSTLPQAVWEARNVACYSEYCHMDGVKHRRCGQNFKTLVRQCRIWVF